MTLDRDAAERRRFARLLGTDERVGSGLPIGRASSKQSVTDHTDERDESRTDDTETGQ
ncbi:hypothetical protein [Natronobacterium gregoryi]|uniref:Uncharacterized protein n=2 Tax=Natronobacterium gregoryi TaxID=44930 RepID=L0AK52_NATGS|nr:hypothetical protein [Natronobacterium gregoryi]AFZ73834.1 hypothetical protein Natgr_2685 [Natronobacterium gregoryi SP2]ELY65081.1 hypothetical protein C490_13965 [Natronobacterium gregoryi SP2]SFJ42170.1 hypothetical protein SAMN05443661_12823 [Natronobacterium gregoryi]